MADCEYLTTCPIFEKSESKVIEGVFASMYCKGSRMELCERRKLKKMGKEVPETLLPNGKHLELLRSEPALKV